MLSIATGMAWWLSGRHTPVQQANPAPPAAPTAKPAAPPSPVSVLVDDVEIDPCMLCPPAVHPFAGERVRGADSQAALAQTAALQAYTARRPRAPMPAPPQATCAGWTSPGWWRPPQAAAMGPWRPLTTTPRAPARTLSRAQKFVQLYDSRKSVVYKAQDACGLERVLKAYKLAALNDADKRKARTTPGTARTHNCR